MACGRGREGFIQVMRGQNPLEDIKGFGGLEDSPIFIKKNSH